MLAKPRHTSSRSTPEQQSIVAPSSMDVLAGPSNSTAELDGATVSQGIAMGLGWIALHRRLLDSPLWQKLCANHKAVMITMLLLANFKPSEFGCRRCKKRIKVGEGEMVYGADRIAELAGVTAKVARAAIANLIADGFLRSQSKERCHSHYVIVKWQLYQDELLGKQERWSQDGHLDGNQHGHLDGNQHGHLDGVHSEEGKKETKKQTTSAPPRKPPKQVKLPKSCQRYSQDDVACAVDFGSLIGLPPGGRPNFGWATFIAGTVAQTIGRERFLADVRALLAKGFQIATPAEAWTKRVKLSQGKRPSGDGGQHSFVMPEE